MEKHEYIKRIEEKEGVFFSKVTIEDIDLPLTEFNKLELVYLEIDHHIRTEQFIIYKSSIPFYLCLKNISEKTYTGTCYFEIKHLDRVNVYLTSKFKKKKNANSDSTRIESKN